MAKSKHPSTSAETLAKNPKKITGTRFEMWRKPKYNYRLFGQNGEELYGGVDGGFGNIAVLKKNIKAILTAFLGENNFGIQYPKRGFDRVFIRAATTIVIPIVWFENHPDS